MGEGQAGLPPKAQEVKPPTSAQKPGEGKQLGVEGTNLTCSCPQGCIPSEGPSQASGGCDQDGGEARAARCPFLLCWSLH